MQHTSHMICSGQCHAIVSGSKQCDAVMYLPVASHNVMQIVSPDGRIASCGVTCVMQAIWF